MIACELCGAAGPHFPFFKEQGIVRCRSCGLVFFDDPVDSAACYGARYFTGGEYWDYLSEKSSLQIDFRRRIRELRRLMPRGKTLLEIGCAYGFFLELARTHWRVQGVDISPFAARLARERLELDVRCGDFLGMPEQGERFDIICLWDTIEHLTHPVRVLEKIAHALRPGGIVAVSTGDIGSWVARCRGARWRQIHPPTHLFYFTPATLSAAFRKAGLAVEEIHHPGQCRSFQGMAHKLLPAERFPRLGPLLTLGGRIDFPTYLNLYDLIVAFARKK